MTDQATPAEVRLTDGLGPLLDSEEDPARLWAEIHTLRAAVQGPDGYATWQAAATVERMLRVKAVETLAAIDRHSVKTLRTNSKDRGDWAEDVAYMGKLARGH